MEKRGELTSKQLITIIILILSFAIIIIFFISLNLRSTTDSEICRNSVISRGGLPLGADTIKLKCKTKDICFNMGGDCDVTRDDLVSIKVQDKEELIQELAILLWDCWYQMGEGKVNYMSAGLGNGEAYCSLCDRVNFDDKIKEIYEEEGGIPYSKIYIYQQSTKIPERDETFLFGIYGVSSLEHFRQDLKDRPNGYDIYSYRMNPNEEQAVVTAIIKNGVWDNIWAGVAIGAVGSSVIGPVGIVGGGLIGGAVGFFTADKSINYMQPRYLESNGAALAALDCKEFVSGA
jgi:hypothetical protein